jgi:hypothetical protein
MIADLFRAVWIALAGGALVFYASRGGGRSPRRWILPLSLTAVLVLASPFGPGLLCYSSDLWMYVTLAERVAIGDWVLDREPLWMEPPADPHQGLEWILIGRLHHWTGLSSLALTELAGVLVFVVLSIAVWRLAREAFQSRQARWIAMLSFWMMAPNMWASLPLSRTLAVAFVVETVRSVVTYRGTSKDIIGLATIVALAFYNQLFGGLLAVLAAGAAAAARAAHETVHGRALLMSGAVALLLASPVVAYAASHSGGHMADAYLHGPGDVRWMGFLWLNPAVLVRQSSAVVLGLAVAGVWPGARAKLNPVLRTFCGLANILVVLVLFTPLYQVGARLIGGWMMPRLAFLGFWWMPAAASLATLLESRQRWISTTGAALAALLFWHGGARVIRDYRHPEVYRPVTASARRDALGLRDVLKDRLYVSSPHLAYFLAAYTLGRPLVVPPGHASPFHPFEQRQRDGLAALSRNTGDCWAALFARYPSVAYLVTPAKADSIEADVWRSDIPEQSPDRVRGELLRLRVLTPVVATGLFNVDELIPSTTVGNPASCGVSHPRP